MDLGIQLTQATLGLDRLYRRRNAGNGVLDKEGLVPVILTDAEPTPYESLQDADAGLQLLEAQLPNVTDPLRRAYTTEMLDSLRALLRTFGDSKISYAERVERCLRVPHNPVSEETLASYRQTIARALTQLGYGGKDFSAELVRWENEQRVPDDLVLTTLQEFLDKARERTFDKMFLFPDGMLKPNGVRNVPFSAYCDYPGRKLNLNLDFGYTRFGLKHLATHEAFPGHYVHLAVREEKTRNGEMPLDASLVVTSCASSPLFEGIAENGIDFLDWVEGPEDELGLALNRLRSAARINAAWMIHGENRPLSEVVAYLMTTCFETRTWAESRTQFLIHPLRSPFIYAYWCGDMAVKKVWDRVQPARRQEFWHYLYGNMHTPTTLDTFWQDQGVDR